MIGTLWRGVGKRELDYGWDIVAHLCGKEAIDTRSALERADRSYCRHDVIYDATGCECWIDHMDSVLGRGADY